MGGQLVCKCRMHGMQIWAACACGIAVHPQSLSPVSSVKVVPRLVPFSLPLEQAAWSWQVDIPLDSELKLSCGRQSMHACKLTTPHVKP